MIDERTMLWIRLNPTTEVAPGASSIDIPHGHYREVYSGEDHPPVAGRILQFGLLRPYKGVETLISAFQLLHEPSASLRLVGRPYTAEYGARIRDLCAETAAISLKLEFVPDSELAEEVRRAELVVLPYTEMHNSGAILVALSLARPVLAPRTRANEMLAEEVGAGWIELFDGVLERSDIESALRAIRSSERGRAPDLSSRDWSVVGQRHRDAYLRALDRRDT
ncbi:glycosyltransferase [Agromyces subbeticus]|uniref:glycosyltransferase n=1 Tax=Agromyces subbeticus TaxID=293890 RepID=UPI00146F09E4|nr:glycosyltransferase [Agromyces subbeticus]